MTARHREGGGAIDRYPPRLGASLVQRPVWLAGRFLPPRGDVLMLACAADPETTRTRAHALRWGLLTTVGAGAVLLLARALTPASATSAVAMERFAGQALALGAPVAGGLVLGWLSLWRS